MRVEGSPREATKNGLVISEDFIVACCQSRGTPPFFFIMWFPLLLHTLGFNDDYQRKKIPYHSEEN